ncbi:putative transmembrane protein [Candidatus Burkholderia humilis]|nr:putative transmembrane protein [Candidatus Burkholderia humilis]
MIHRPRWSFLTSSHAALAAIAFALGAACWTIPGDAFAQAGNAAASAAAAVSAAAATGQTYTVKPGQSLNDVAGELTGSKDKDMRAKMARALFDANPNAFTARDINRLKLGAVLNVSPAEGGAAFAPVATASEAAPALAVSAPAQTAPAPSKGGFNPMLIGLAVAVIVVLLLVMMLRKGKRRRDEEEASAARAPEPMQPAARAATASAEPLESEAVQRDQSELNAVAASIESYDAAQSFATPTEEAPELAPETAKLVEPEAKAEAAPALSKEIFARETQLRDAEARQAAEQEEQAREAAAREISAREAELRETQKREVEERAAATRDPDDEDAEPPAEHRFPMPKFPQDAIQALGSLEMGLPPRMELTLDLPTGKVTSNSVEPSVTAAKPSLVPPPAAGHDFEPPSAASQIEAGTAGAASVAGLGATQFAPLSLDFDMGLPKSHTEPLPALTSAQIAAIARNKLELAQEYMELGDLPGARTLLQEVIESNDPATRQHAAALLSTLAPHS